VARSTWVHLVWICIEMILRRWPLCCLEDPVVRCWHQVRFILDFTDMRGTSSGSIWDIGGGGFGALLYSLGTVHCCNFSSKTFWRSKDNLSIFMLSQGLFPHCMSIHCLSAAIVNQLEATTNKLLHSLKAFIQVFQMTEKNKNARQC
jgi:hypothetical protein